MNCQHYHICISKNGSLCEDSKCVINKKQRLKENEERLQEVRRLLDNYKKKLWLSHYQDFVSEYKDFKGQTCDWDELAEQDGFAGFVKVGQVFEV